MPIIKSAKKKLKQDHKKHAQNKRFIVSYKNAIKKIQHKDTKMSIQKVYSSLDKAVKKGIIHKNKAARLKSRLAKFIKKTA